MQFISEALGPWTTSVFRGLLNATGKRVEAANRSRQRSHEQSEFRAQARDSVVWNFTNQTEWWFLDALTHHGLISGFGILSLASTRCA